MYRLTVRDRVMIAHSFTGEVFGPAQGVHGATYVVEAEFRSATLDGHNLVVDIGLAHEALGRVLGTLNYKNLDDLEIFAGENTTTEFLAAWVWSEIVGEIKAGKLGEHTLCGLGINLRESDVAWASYEAPLA
jgi:6-pyruvoyltetrahydropterin/6-carboxytetrahydropterin synthase